MGGAVTCVPFDAVSCQQVSGDTSEATRAPVPTYVILVVTVAAATATSSVMLVAAKGPTNEARVAHAMLVFSATSSCVCAFGVSLRRLGLAQPLAPAFSLLFPVPLYG